MGTLDPLTVSVSWLEVPGAERYEVRFSLIRGDQQVGICTQSFHDPRFRIGAISGQGGRVAGTIPVGDNVKTNLQDMLRAFSTYSVEVEAESDDLGTSHDSEIILYTTPQIGEHNVYDVRSIHPCFQLSDLLWLLYISPRFFCLFPLLLQLFHLSFQFC